jgi:type VI secretion system protein ImpK
MTPEAAMVQEQEPVPPAALPRAPVVASIQLHGTGLNPVVRAANPLLDLIMPLRAMTTYANLDELREQLVHAIRNFESDLKTRRLDPELIAAARYVLCTFLDETISSTPWGGNGAWATKSLLVAFHNEAWGGEKVFLILQRLSQNPRANLDVLELIYLCLALGLEGRYRVRDGGRDQLETLRERLRQMIQTQRGVYERDLSLRWRGATDKRHSLLQAMPVWVLGAVAGALLVVMHLALSYVLNRESDPVFAALHKIQVSLPPAPQPAVPTALPPAPIVRLAGFLASDVERGLVAVTETADRSTVTLRGDGLFASGSADVMRDFEPLLGRIGDALKAVPGKVIVVGHTDDVRSFSARFPSNWELSKARAASVVKLLAQRAGPDARYSVIGRGETEPLAPNDSPANRARNRRVDIILLTPAP